MDRMTLFFQKYFSNQAGWLVIVMLIAGLVRLVALGEVPASLYWEEAALGYDAYSILTTGKDYHGNPWPVVAFESFGDYKPSGYFYALVPFIHFLGLNEWAVRLPSALAGVMTVALVYVIGASVSGNAKVGLSGALVLSLMPWHIQFSRAGFEATVAVFLLCGGIWMLVKARKKPVYLLAGALLMVAAMYTYHSTRMVAPLMALYMAFLWGKHWIRSGWLYLSLVVAVLVSAPLIGALGSQTINQRFAETSIFSTSTAVVETNTWRQEDGNFLLSRLLHHRYWQWGKEIASNSFSHFSLGFLFLRGDGNNRHQTGWFGLLLPITGVFLLAAFLPQKKGQDTKLGWLILGWVIIASLPSGLTNAVPHTLRFLPAAPAVALLLGWGMVKLWQVARERYWWVFGGVVILFGLSAGIYLYDYFGRYAHQSSQDWQYGYKQVMAYISSRESDDESIYITRAYGRPSIYVLFYSAYPPSLIQREGESAPQDQGELLAFGNYQFISPDQVDSGLVVSDEPYSRGTLMNTIYFLDGTPAFYIYEI